MKTDVEFIPYGAISSRLSRSGWRMLSQGSRILEPRERPGRWPQSIFVTLSTDLDATFVRMFRKRARPDSRLLIVNQGGSTDSLLSRIVGLQIRTPQRFCVIDAGAGRTNYSIFVQGIFKRLKSGLKNGDRLERILDARVEEGVLHVVSPSFNRLDVPVAKVPQFTNADRCDIETFEIDEDGSFVYWPRLDVHLDWAQLQQVIDPEAARRAFQRSRDFNVRYGKAVQRVRQRTGLKPGDVSGISQKQLRRIEAGECRLTANAIEALSKSHTLAPNQYMDKLAKALD